MCSGKHELTFSRIFFYFYLTHNVTLQRHFLHKNKLNIYFSSFLNSKFFSFQNPSVSISHNRVLCYQRQVKLLSRNLQFNYRTRRLDVDHANPFSDRKPLNPRKWVTLGTVLNRGVFNPVEAPLSSKEGASDPSEEAPWSLRHAFALHGMRNPIYHL